MRCFSWPTEVSSATIRYRSSSARLPCARTTMRRVTLSLSADGPGGGFAVAMAIQQKTCYVRKRLSIVQGDRSTEQTMNGRPWLLQAKEDSWSVVNG